MAMQTRIYAVANGAGPTRLVEATSTAQALRHVAEQTFTVAIAKPKDVAALMAQGVALETAGDVSQ
jgi:hypothetical protein